MHEHDVDSDHREQKLITTQAGVTQSIRYGWRRRIGMLVPSVNRVAESEIAALMPDGVSPHTTHLKLTGSSREDLLAMTEKVEEGAALLGDAGGDLIVFHCTAEHRRADADPYFLSCTAIRTLPIIQVLESDLGKPVVRSNQSIVWRALRTAGIRDSITGYGTLLSRC